MQKEITYYEIEIEVKIEFGTEYGMKPVGRIDFEDVPVTVVETVTVTDGKGREWDMTDKMVKHDEEQLEKIASDYSDDCNNDAAEAAYENKMDAMQSRYEAANY